MLSGPDEPHNSNESIHHEPVPTVISSTLISELLTNVGHTGLAQKNRMTGHVAPIMNKFIS